MAIAVTYTRSSLGKEWIVVEGATGGRSVKITPRKGGGVTIRGRGIVDTVDVRNDIAAAAGVKRFGWDALVAASGRAGGAMRAGPRGGLTPSTAPFVAADGEKLDPGKTTARFSDGVAIIADTREPRHVSDALARIPGVTVVRKALPVGDYSVAGRLVVERKTCEDLDKSLLAADGRMLSQVSRLSQLPGVRVIVVEGLYGSRRWPLDALTGVMAGIVALEGVSVIPSLSPVHTAHIVAHLAFHVLRGGHHAPGLWPGSTAPKKRRTRRDDAVHALPPLGVTGDLFGSVSA